MLEMKLKLLWMQVIVVMVLGCVGGKASKGVLSDSGVKRVKGTYGDKLLEGKYEIRYYLNPSYIFKEKSYKFLMGRKLRVKAKEGGRRKVLGSAYYKVYYGKGGKIKGFEEYRHHTLTSRSLYRYEGEQVKRVDRYFNEGMLSMSEYYGQGGYVEKLKKFAKGGKITYAGSVIYTKLGRKDIWRDLRGIRRYAVEYDRRGRVRNYIYYKSGRINLKIEYKYGKNNVLLRQEYYNVEGKKTREVRFKYKKTGHLLKTISFESAGKVERYFNKFGYEVLIKEYVGNRLRLRGEVSYEKGTDIGYKEAGLSMIKHIKWYKLDGRDERVISERYEGVWGELLKEIGYGIMGEERERVEVLYKGGYRSREELYEGRGLILRRLYDEKGRLTKEEKYGALGKELLGYALYKYDGSGFLKLKDDYGRGGELKSIESYVYGKRGELVMTMVEEGAKKTSRYYEYNKSGEVVVIKVFDRNDELVRREYIDNKGRRYRVESGKGVLNNVVVYRYRGDKVAQEEHYDRYKNLIRTLTFTYGKGGELIREDGFDGRRQYLGSILYRYDKSGKLESEERTNHLKEVYERVYYGEGGQIKSVEKVRAR